jgi:hypothetical protein
MMEWCLYSNLDGISDRQAIELLAWQILFVAKQARAGPRVRSGSSNVLLFFIWLYGAMSVYYSRFLHIFFAEDERLVQPGGFFRLVLHFWRWLGVLSLHCICWRGEIGDVYQDEMRLDAGE